MVNRGWEMELGLGRGGSAKKRRASRSLPRAAMGVVGLDRPSKHVPEVVRLIRVGVCVWELGSLSACKYCTMVSRVS